MCQFYAPRNFEVRKAVILEDASNPSPEDTETIYEELDVDASAHHSKRISVDAEGANQRLAEFADGAVG